MKNYTLNYEVIGCPNTCKHCYCDELKSQRTLISIEDIVSLSNSFKHKINGDVNVLLLQEQTMYPDFIKVIDTLKKENLMTSGKRGLLVTNGFGIATNPSMIKDIKKHYSTVKLTLFGTEYIHDAFVQRKGHFEELIKVTNLCHENQIDVIWQIMLTNGNSKNIEQVIMLADEIKVDGYFVTGAFNYAGAMKKNKHIMPTEKDLKYKTFHIYEQEHELFLPEYKYDEIKSSVDDYHINKVSLENLYIDSHFDVYPLDNIEATFKLGNIKNNMGDLVQRLNDYNHLPKSIKKRMNYSLLQLIDQVLNIESTEMHTPQTLFEKLAYIKENS